MTDTQWFLEKRLHRADGEWERIGEPIPISTSEDEAVDSAVAAYNVVWQAWKYLDASSVDQCRRTAMTAALTAASVHTGERMARAIEVPAVPTEAMLEAARDWSLRKYGKPIGNDAAMGCWRVMFAAYLVSAPRAPEPMAGAVEGWKLVPVEPTDEMLDGARDWSIRAYGKAVGNHGATGCYRAMLAASPPPPDGWRGIESAPRDANAMTVVELQAEIGRLQGVLHFKVCGDPRVSVSVSPPGEKLGKG